MPMMPVPGTSGEGGAHVRLTPITGRVSRAKKGVRVHTCDICRPPKTFTRAEHLRRHQLSHKTPQHPCTYPGCDKTFHRADLLARHAPKHEQDDRSSRTANSRRTSGASASLEETAPGRISAYTQPMSGPSGSRQPTGGPAEMTSNSPYSMTPPSYSMSNQGGSSTGQPPAMSPPQGPDRRDRPPSGQYMLVNEPMHVIADQTHGGSTMASGIPYGPLDYQPRTYPFYMETQGLSHALPSLTIPDSNIPGLLPPSEASPWASSTPDSNFSTPSEGHNQPVPTQDWSSSHLYHSGPSSGLHSPDGGLDVMTSGNAFFLQPFSSPPHHVTSSFDPSMEFPMSIPEEHALLENPHSYSSVRSPTPPTLSLTGQSAETLVTTAAPSFADTSAALGRHKNTSGLLGPYAGAVFATALTMPKGLRSSIPQYLEVYWKRFHTFFPLVHRRTFETGANEFLRCAMAAVGTQFLEGKVNRENGSRLHELASQEARRYTQWNVQVMQTILLCEYYARFRGKKLSIRASQPFQSIYSRVANSRTPDDHMSAFASSAITTTATTAPTSTSSSSDAAMARNQRWDAWVEAESRRRLLAACFVLDVHSSVYHEQQLIQPFNTPTPPIPLTQPTEGIWTARSAEEWEARCISRSTSATKNMEPVLSEDIILTPERIAAAPPLDRAIFLASEYLRLPKRENPAVLNLSAEANLTEANLSSAAANRMDSLFRESTVANAYLALHHTPLQDLLAVSGDTWLFTRKVLEAHDYGQHQRNLKLWSGSLRAAAATRFAARALLGFLVDHDINDNTTILTATTTSTSITMLRRRSYVSKHHHHDQADDDTNTNENDDIAIGEEEADITTPRGARDRGSAAAAAATELTREWNMLDISDYWAMYVCALICWALGHRVTRSSAVTTATPASSSTTKIAVARSERDVKAWLKMVAALTPDDVRNVRGRREIAGVVSMVRRRLEHELQDSRANLLLIDAVGVLRKLEEGSGHKLF
ncbi:hypothetical protein F4778DRAFT_782345 [Xylariomycetidae sp. FL2044]|nr:hypothetical protein F4778DRAFT_782345 [Xylariomycetidae sp. FL2044]